MSQSIRHSVRAGLAVAAAAALSVSAAGVASAQEEAYPEPTVSAQADGNNIITTITDNGGGAYSVTVSPTADGTVSVTDPAGAAQDAAANGIDIIYSSTQAHNVRAQRAWLPAGFLPIQGIDTLHVVRTSLLGEA